MNVFLKRKTQDQNENIGKFQLHVRECTFRTALAVRFREVSIFYEVAIMKMT